MPEFEVYQSPFTWRYASPEMRLIWSEKKKRLIWRQIWVTLARVQSEFGLVSPKQLADLQSHVADIDVDESLRIEVETRHDLVAELRVFAKQSSIGGAILHLGATSADIEDNADVLRARNAAQVIMSKLDILLHRLGERIDAWAEIPVMAITHLQPAEPTSLGYRFSFYAQDLLRDMENLTRLISELKGKGFKGSVGNAAAFVELLGEDRFPKFEKRLEEELGLPFFQISTQVYPRKQDYEMICCLAGLGCSLYKLAFDLRLLQSPFFGEVSEPFGGLQVGSSAMPFKKNPINCEKIDSLARLLAQMPPIAWNNAAHSLLERTLDDSANRRVLLPEAFLICDELLGTAIPLITGLEVDKRAAAKNLEDYAPFSASERVLNAVVLAGADRQQAHERLRHHALDARESMRAGTPNSFKTLICKDVFFLSFVPQDSLRNLFDLEGFLGIAPQRARETAHFIANL